jgi:hypothetical protein
VLLLVRLASRSHYHASSEPCLTNGFGAFPQTPAVPSAARPQKPQPYRALKTPRKEQTPRCGADAQPQPVAGWPRGKQVRRRHEVDSPPALSHSSIQMRRLPPAVALLLRRSLASAALLPAPVRPLPLSPVIF